MSGSGSRTPWTTSTTTRRRRTTPDNAGALLRWGEGGGPREAGGAALRRDHQRHLARRFVDHLVAEHDGAELAARLGGVVPVRVEDQLGVVVVGLRGRVHLVGRVDLA